ncbi:parallel beta-helix repeat protein [Rhodoblastus acidophilus]|uniref:right-handed parallel beta-helix repeat-containing protein n=1 Tax=Rhodoblastus acidophilus TaxID=1074 RepID=UPI002224945A|nr:right-handed parallel beta-helix repeat-containing protein [Rhodoblastus acidophilus]MCW2284563.1 parallel beta-helix repeat protein [Rhodoblastus acidophilus]MCW2333516.1 parallel beta-helix repeat protein [Rhodoblastus acidophilus]
MGKIGGTPSKPLGAARRGARAEAQAHARRFAVDALEPRLLLSADLNVAAGHALIAGLGDLQAALDLPGQAAGGDPALPFIHRAIEEFGKLGDPLATVIAQANQYLNGAGANASFAGLAASLNAIPATPDAHGVTTKVNAAVASAANGDPEIALSVVQTTAGLAGLVFDLSGESSLGLSFDAGATKAATSTATTTLSLTLGVDASNAFFVAAGGGGAETVAAQASLAGGLTVGHVDTAMAAGASGQSSATIGAKIANPDGTGRVSDAALQAAVNAPASQTLVVADHTAGPTGAVTASLTSTAFSGTQAFSLSDAPGASGAHAKLTLDAALRAAATGDLTGDGAAIAAGLQDLQTALGQDATAAAHTALPFVGKTLGDFGGVGDPLTLVVAEIKSYFAAAAAPTIDGLAAALNATPAGVDAHGAVTKVNAVALEAADGAREIALTVTRTPAPLTGLSIDLANESGVLLAFDAGAGHAATSATTTTLALTFGATAAGAFFVNAAGKAAETVAIASTLSGGLTVGHTDTTLQSGSATVNAGLTLTLGDPDHTGRITDADLKAQTAQNPVAAAALTGPVGVVDAKVVSKSGDFTGAQALHLTDSGAQTGLAASLTLDAGLKAAAAGNSSSFVTSAALSEAFSTFLDALQSDLDASAYNALPLLGSALAQGALTGGFLTGAAQALANSATAVGASAVQTLLFNDLKSVLYKSDGKTAATQASDIVIEYFDHGAVVSAADVASGHVFDKIDYLLPLGGEISAAVAASLGLSALFSPDAPFGLTASVNWSLTLALGVDASNRGYVTPKSNLAVSIGASIADGTSLTGSFGDLKAALTQDNSKGTTGVSDTFTLALGVGTALQGSALSVSPTVSESGFKASVDLQASMGFVLNGGAVDNTTLGLSAEILGAWSQDNPAPDFKIANISLGLSGIASQLAQDLQPLDTILAAIQPVTDFVTAPLPLLSDIFGKSANLINIAAFMAGESSGFGDSDIVAVLNKVGEVDNFLNALQGLADDKAAINLGTLDLSAYAGQIDSPGGLSGVLDTTFAGLFSGGSTGLDSAVQSLESVAALAGVSLPILDNPARVVADLFLKQDSNLVVADLGSGSITAPLVSMEFPFPAFPGLMIGFQVNFTFDFGLKFGYDTKGLEEYAQTGNAASISDGFYIDDAGTKLKLELGLNLTANAAGVIGIYGGLDGGIAFSPAGVGGKTRLDAFNAAGGDLGALITTQAEVDLQVGVDINLFLTTIDIPIINVTLFKFPNDGPPPDIADQDAATGVVYLNAGPRAYLQTDPNLTGGFGTVTPATYDKNDKFSVTQVSPGVIQVAANGASKRFSNVTGVFFDGGKGDDQIFVGKLLDADGKTPINSTILGGAGNDKITAEYGHNLIEGGTGDDKITGGAATSTIYGGNGQLFDINGKPVASGYDGASFDSSGDTGVDPKGNPIVSDIIAMGVGSNTVYGSSGADVFSAGGGANIIATGDGQDSVSVGDGANSITGGVGKDTITGGNGANTIRAGVGDYSISVGNGANSIVGGHGANTILAGNGANSIYGGVGNASITAGTGANTIYGGIGNDTIVAGLGGTGANSITGGTGNDSIVAGDGANTIFGGTGDTTIRAGDGDNSIIGGVATHGDVIIVGVGANSITGGTGDDSIVAGAIGSGAGSLIGGTGANSIVGGTGNTTIRAGNGANTIFGGVGDDLIVVGDGANTILGGTGNTTILAGAGRNSIVGGAGNDSIVAGDGANIIWGNNSVYGGTGNDTIVVGSGQNTIYGGTGNASIVAGNGANIIFGGIGSATISTGTGDNTITGGTGDNLIMVAGGQNVIDAGDGKNTIFGGAGSDIIRAGKGANKVTAGSGKEYIALGDGSNTVYGGAGPDNVSVGDGDNYIYGGAGADTIVAGAGKNVIFGGQSDNFIADGAGHALIQGGGGDNLIYGGGLASTIIGGAGNDTIFGGGGGNLIVGGTGKVTVYGGAGGDSVYGALGDSELHSGGGATKIFGDHAGLTFALSALGALTKGVAAPNTGPTNQRVTLYGGAGPDSLTGGAGANTIYGGTGTRAIQGGGVASYIQAGPGAGVIVHAGDSGDVIIGSDGGGDSIYGGAGADRIELRGGGNYAEGGGGPNVIVGSTGKDSLVGSSGQDTLIGGAASNILTDSSAHKTDTLVANSGETGDSLSSPSLVAATPKVALPRDSVADGWWSPILGTAGVQLGADASTPVIAADANGPWLAWTQTNAGGRGLYVAQDINGVWTAFGGSDTGLGLGLAGTAASHPAIAIVNGAPVVAWTATSASGRAIMAATWSASANGGAGGWIALGGSLASGGISGFGAYDDARVVATANGPVVVWRDSSGQASLDALRFDGANWVNLGASRALAGSSGVGEDFSVAASGANVAVGFSLAAANGFALHVLQYGAGAWTALPPPNAATAAGPDASFSQAPSLAYANGGLFIAWAQKDVTTSYDSALYAEVWSGGAWSPAGAGAASKLGLTNLGETVATPTLASNGAALTLLWTSTQQTAGGQIDALRAANWNGKAFVAAQPSDVAGTGVGQLAGVPTSLSASLDAGGRAFLAYQNQGGAGVVARAGATGAAHMFVAKGATTIASLLASGNVHSGDLILVAGATSDTALTLGASAAGVTIAGVDGAVFAQDITIQGATGVTLRNLIVTGAVTIHSTAHVTLAENRLAGVTLDGAANLAMRGNALQSLTVATASGGEIFANTFAGGATALTLSAAFSGLIHDNDLSASGTVVVYHAAAALASNRIHGGAVGVATTIADGATLFGAVAGSKPNTITGNVVGVQLTAAQVINQIIIANATGLSGSGVIGGTSAALYNIISYNATGVGGFTGLVQFNRIDDNGVGVAATDGLNIYSNQLVGNTQDAILVSGAARVQIAGNTIHSYIGDGVHLQNAAKDVALVSNIIWTDSGTGVYVANDSQTGFWSDHNNLYATGAGTIVYWTKYFTDILDWRDDVAIYDLHSIGATKVNPSYAEPHFGVDQYGFLVTRPPVTGLQATDPTIDGGDPAGRFYGFTGAANLLVNSGFANGLTGWIATAGGSTVTAPLTPWNGAAEYQSGASANTVLQQTVSLLQNGVTASEIDAGSVQVAFGGQVGAASAAVAAQISVLFLDAGGNAIGNAVVIPATGASAAAWTRVFDTIVAPSGARSVEYLFSVAKTDSSAGGWLDNPFLTVLPQGLGQDQGLRTAPDVLPDLATLGRIQLQSPQYYLNWVANAPMFITWNAYGAATGQPVRLELWRDGPNGPAYLSTIAASTPDTGSYAWSPSLAGVQPGTSGLRIRIASVAHPGVFDLSQETFAVPKVGSQFYVATSADGGSNRNTGVSADSALPNPSNLFRAYAIGAGATVNIAAGDYPLIAPLTLSGATDLGYGLDSGFTIQGATKGVVNLHQANPLITPQALIHISNASYVTLNNLTLTGGVEGLLVDNGSNTFNASYLTATGQSYAGFVVTTNSPAGTLDHFTATNTGQYGLLFNGVIGAISNMVQSGAQYGLYAYPNTGSESIARITHSSFSNDSYYGAYLYLYGDSVITGSTFSGNGTGVYLNGSGIVFGDANLGDGNVVTGSANQALSSSGARIVGNVFSNTSGAASVAEVYSGSFADNLVYGNSRGVKIYGTQAAPVSGNRIFNNAGPGLSVSATGATVSGNTLYSNAYGVIVSASGVTLANNLVYANSYAGILLYSAANATLTNNTVYEPTAGKVSDTYSNYDTGAIVLDADSTGATLRNNIVVALAGAGLFVSNTSQSGFNSDYNLFQTSGSGKVGSWLGGGGATLAIWSAVTAQDKHSLAGDPLFVNPTGGAASAGYLSPTQNGVADDFHLQSRQGSDHGGSLAVVPGANGLPVLPTGAYVADSASSPGVAAGDPATPIGAQPQPNGGVVEIGAYGATTESSLTPAAFIKVNAPSAGALLTQGNTVTISWTAFNIAGDVSISVSSGGVTKVLAADVADSGTYSWTIDGKVFAPGSTYVVRVASLTTPSLFGESSAFAIAAPVHVYYVNASATGGQYTTAAGSDTAYGASGGLTAATPFASLGALLSAYTLKAGDIVYVDAGTYALSNNLVFGSAIAGTATAPVTIQGPTQSGLSATFDRQATTAGFYAFDFKGATHVVLSNLTIKNGYAGVELEDNAGSTGITVQNTTLDGNVNNVYAGAGDNNFTLINSTLTNSGAEGVYISSASNATIANTTISTSARTSAVHLKYADNATIANDTLTALAYGASGLQAEWSNNVLVNGVIITGGGSANYGASFSGGNGLIENSTIDASGATHGLEISGYNGLMVAQNNVIHNQVAGNSYGGGLIVDDGALAQNNTIYSSDIGIRIGGATGVAQNNIVYGNVTGLLLSSGKALGNAIYNNTTVGAILDGSDTTFNNNTLYGNADAIQVGQYSSSARHTIDNNTILQSGGWALNLATTGAAATRFEDNILSLSNGAVGILAPIANQVGFVSDYNLYQLDASAKISTWSGQSFADLTLFKIDVGQDANSFVADPLFVDPANRNYTLQSGSPALNRGDPALIYALEPQGDGSRIDIGAQGGTALANPGPAQIVQLLGQTGGQRYQVGQGVTVAYTSAGLSAVTPVLQMVAGNEGQLKGADPSNVWQAAQYATTTPNYTSNSTTVSANGLNVPQAMLQNFAYWSSASNGAYAIPLAAGTYQVTLIFSEPWASGAGQRTFDIVANGVTVASGYDIFKAAGAANTAVAFTFTTTVGASGLNLQLKGVVSYPLLNGVQIALANPAATWTGIAYASYDNGVNWSQVASGLTFDAYGAGSFTFNPTQATTQGLLKIVASHGAQSVSDVSISPFTSLAAVNQYYVSTSGSDLNTGASADAPMASLAALLNVYHLKAGDIVHVAAGTYVLPAAIALAADDSGAAGDPVVIEGQGASTIFKVNSTAAGTAAFTFAGAHDVTLKNFAVFGGATGLNVAGGAGAAGVTLSGLDISGFSSQGVFVGAGAAGFTLTGSTVHGPVNADATGLYIDVSSNAAISGNTFSGLYRGVAIVGDASLSLSGNTFTDNRMAIDGNVDSGAASKIVVDSNVVTTNVAYSGGILLNYTYSKAGAVLQVVNNQISGATYADAISVAGAFTVSGNVLTNNAQGISLNNGAVATGNRVTGSTTYGIYVTNSSGAVTGNTLIGNAVGVKSAVYGALVANNLFLNNTTAVENDYTLTLRNNTFVQASGVAVLNASTNAVTIENNIFALSGGAVYSAAAANQAQFRSDYNLFHLSGAAVMANWAGLTISDFNAWMFGTGLDCNGVAADPQFTDAASGDYTLRAGSPAIDAGNPLSAYNLEPGNNGGRVNIGMDGDTARATQSPAVVIQINSPTLDAKLQQGVATTIAFATHGVSGLELAAQWNEGGPALTGATLESNFASDTAVYGTLSTAAAIDLSASTSGAPAALYQSALYGAYGVGSSIVRTLALADGQYQVTLNFAEIAGATAGQRAFDIKINGVKVASSFDIVKAAGGKANAAVDLSFAATASGGTGVTIELDSLTASYPALLSGIEVGRVTASTASKTARVEVSPDGQAWYTVAAAAPIDQYGFGAVAWTPNFQTNGNAAQVRVTVNGVAALSRHFLVANAGNFYYVAPASSTSWQYATAAGNNLNSGKTPDAPMADLSALLRAYTLKAGDIVYIDAGVYTEYSNALLTAADSGTGAGIGQTITFQGPTTGTATLDRANLTADAVEIAGASYVVFDHLTFAHGNAGVALDDNSGAVGVVIRNSVFRGNQTYGVYVGGGGDKFTLANSRIFDAGGIYSSYGVYVSGSAWTGQTASLLDNEIYGQAYGIAVYGPGGAISGNSVHDNTYGGIDATDTGSPTNPLLTVSGNNVFNNGATTTSAYGVNAYGANVRVTGNAIYNQTGGSDVGLKLSGGAVATGNIIYGNYDGVALSDAISPLTGNRIFANSDAGVTTNANGGLVLNNRIYSNGVGVVSAGALNLQNNLIYDDANGAVSLTNGYSSVKTQIIGNTLWQSVGTVVDISGGSAPVVFADNIVWGDLGALLDVASKFTGAMSAQYNLYYRGANGAATAANIAGTAYATLAAWKTGQPGQNVGSVEGDPKFIAIAGADGVRGGLDTALGGGADDDFTPGAHSPAIDAANAYLQSNTDMLGQPRHDDPAVANTGTGQPLYQATAAAPATLPTGTYLSGTQSYAGYSVAYNLSAPFTFYGVSYSTVYLSPTGAIFFSAAAAGQIGGVAPSQANFAATAMIAPFWSTADTRNGGIYVDTSAAGFVTFRWVATQAGANSASATINFAVKLGLNDGSIALEYGTIPSGVTGLIGVSAGTGVIYTLASTSGQADLSNSGAIVLTPNQSLGFVSNDIGAIEFQGSSANKTPPVITGATNLPANGAKTDAAFSSITLNFSETLDPISAASAANYQLVAAGPDGKFGTADDIAIPLVVVYASSSQSVTLAFAKGPLGDGLYQLTVSKNGGLLDSSGNALDGDSNGTAGGAFVRAFTIDRGAIKAPVVADQTLTTPNNAPLVVNIGATDPQGLALVYAIAQAPSHGQIVNFDSANGSFTYLPALGYVGADIIKVSVVDAKLAQSVATITVNDTKVMQPPIAAPTSAQAIAGQTTMIAVTGSDVQTPVNQLVLSIVTQPAHGVAAITGQNTLSYKANAGYSGPDSFTFAWTDTGSPPGSLNPGVTSAPATVSLSVITVNQAPTTADTTIATPHDTPYVFKLSDFPYSDAQNGAPTALKAVIVESLPALGALTDKGAAVQIGQAVAAADIAAGKLVFTPAAGGFGLAYASFSFAVQNSGGTANGGQDISSAKTATITVAITPTVTVGIGATLLTLAQPTTTVTFAFSQAPSDFTLADVTAAGGTLSHLAGSGLTYTATFTAASGVAIHNASVSVTAGVWHAEGFAGAGADSAAFAVDTVAPSVVSVSAGGAALLGAGAKITIVVTLSKPVTVSGGSPTLSLGNGGAATYDAQASAKLGGAALAFDYTVGAGQDTPALAVSGLVLNGAAIIDADGNPAIVSGVALAPTVGVITTDPAEITVAQALQAESGALTLNVPGAKLVVADKAAALAGLSVAEISGLAALGVTRLHALDAAPAFTAQQRAAIGGAGLSLVLPFNATSAQTQTFYANGAVKTAIVAAGGTMQGQTYASSESDYLPTGFRTQQIWYDANGHAVVVRTNQQNGSNPNIGYTLTVNGAVVQSRTVNANGSYVDRTYAPGQVWNVSYSYYDIAYNASRARTSETWWRVSAPGAAPVVAAVETFSANGGYVITVGGALHQKKVVAPDLSYSIQTFAAGVYNAQVYASVLVKYAANGAVLSTTYYTKAGQPLAAASIMSFAAPATVTLSTADAAPTVAAASLVAAPAQAPQPSVPAAPVSAAPEIAATSVPVARVTLAKAAPAAPPQSETASPRGTSYATVERTRLGPVGANARVVLADSVRAPAASVAPAPTGASRAAEGGLSFVSVPVSSSSGVAFHAIPRANASPGGGGGGDDAPESSAGAPPPRDDGAGQPAATPERAALREPRLGLMLGAPPASPRADLDRMFGEAARSRALEAALIGFAPLARGLATRRAGKPDLVLYDMIEDRFQDPEDPGDDDGVDLPLSAHSDQGVVDWIAVE